MFIFPRLLSTYIIEYLHMVPSNIRFDAGSKKILGRTWPKYFSETVKKRKLKIRVPYDNDEISKYVTKNNKYIPYVAVCHYFLF